MNNYDPFKKNITCDKVFTYIEGGTQSFCIEHENGSIHDFPYAYVSYSYLSPDYAAIKIKHSYCDILLCGTNLDNIYKKIRSREVDTIKIGNEVENKEGGLISARAVYYENLSEDPLSGAMTGSDDNDEPDTERDISKSMGIGC